MPEGRTKSRYRRLFTYEFHVNGIMLDALVEAGGTLDLTNEWRLMTHLLAAQEVWLARMEDRSSSVPVWPDSDSDLCRRLLEQNRQAYEALLQEVDFDRDCSYSDSKGNAFTSPIAEILDHLLLHAAYHRGQIATGLRRQGLEAPRTDYIVWARGLLD